MLPGHARWSRFFGSLRYVVVDECHHYRGVFGAHVAQILRRLRRVAALYGAHPTFVLASATVAEPEVSAGRLTGLEVDGGHRRRLAARPHGAGPVGAAVRARGWARTARPYAAPRPARSPTCSPTSSSSGCARSRSSAPGAAPRRWPLTARRLLGEVDASPGRPGGGLPRRLPARGAPRARGGAALGGRLLGLAATNALELGIDISGLDAVLLAGFPGTRAALWQQVGRAGRGARDALGVLVARDDPLDTYLVNHPEALLGQPVEANVFDPDNPYVLGPHLCAAAAESPAHASTTCRCSAPAHGQRSTR